MEKPDNTKSNEQSQKNRIFFQTDKAKRPLALKVGISAIMTSLNAIITVLISIYLPGSYGFFNIGESMVYLSAILFGPYIGAISGGLGGMFADIFLGYYSYAPGTLIVKGIEGLIVGFVYQKLTQIRSMQDTQEKTPLKTFIVVLSALGVSGVIMGIGFLLYIGEANFLQIFREVYLLSINFTYVFWTIIAVICSLSIILIYIFVDPRISLKIISMLAGGMILIPGYLLVGGIIYGFTAAVTEIPFNIMQVVLGIAIAVPISQPIRNTLKL